MILLKLKTYSIQSLAENPLRKRSKILRVAVRIALESWAAVLIAILPLTLYFIYRISDALLHPNDPFQIRRFLPKPDVTGQFGHVYLVGMMCWGVVKLMPHVAEWVKNIRTLAQRFTTVDAELALAQDLRAPVLYLRPFLDRYTDNDILAQTESDENLMFPVLREVGPVIAIGQPGETLPPSGAARVYLEKDCNWQVTVTDYFSRSKLVVISPGYSDGVIWEASKAFQTCPPEKIIISLISFNPKLNYSKTLNEYKIFRNAIKTNTKINLPENISESLFIYFDSDRKPRLAKADVSRLNSLFIEVEVRDALQKLLQSKSLYVSRDMPLGWYVSNKYESLIKLVALLIPILTTIKILAEWSD